MHTVSNLIFCVQVNLYDVLGVEKNASEQEIKKAPSMLGNEKIRQN